MDRQQAFLAGIPLPAVMLTAALLTVAGCGPARDYGPLAEISGTVRIDGQPLANGTISFVTPATGDLQVFEVSDGRFAGRARAGERRVEVRGYAAPAAGSPGGPTDIPGPAGFAANTLPDHLGPYSTLTVTITAEGQGELSFDLQTKPAFGGQGAR